MYSIISHLFHNTTKPIKLLSTNDGHIKFETLDEVKIYAHTQGVFYFALKGIYKEAEYYVQLAELMRAENHHRWAAHCYLKALEEAWGTYHRVAVDGTRYHDQEHDHKCIDPYNIYEDARLHLLGINNLNGLKKLKEVHLKSRLYAHLELEYTQYSRDSERKRKIEKLLERDFSAFNCDSDATDI